MNKTPTSNSNRFDVGRLYRLACKELVEILRDRRTIVTLIMMPLLVYPLMGIVVQKLVLQSLSNAPKITYNLGFDSEEQVEPFSELFKVGEQSIRSLAAEASLKRETEAVSQTERVKQKLQQAITSKQKTEVKYFSTEDVPLEDLILAGDIDVGIRVDSESANRKYQLIYDAQNQYGSSAVRYIGKRLRHANDFFLEQAAKVGGVQASFPGSFREVALENQTQREPILLTFVPLMLVLMTITGAVYPAIDLTAGERERGTMEILVAAPVPRLVVLIGKFVAVLTVAILTALANLVAMTVTVYSLGLDSLIFGDAVFDAATIGLIFVLLFVLAAFFSATLLGLTSFARSFKEAQAYLIPLMLVAFAPGLISLSPNLKTTAFLSVVPLVNIVLVGRDLLAGQAEFVLVAIAICSTILYGLLALSLAAKVFGTDSVLTGGKSSWSDLLLRPQEQQSSPDMQSFTLLLAILFPAFVVLAGLSSNLVTRFEGSFVQRLWVNAGITIFLFAGLPFLFALFSNLKINSTFAFNRPSTLAVLAAILFGSSVWVFAYEIEILTLSDARIERLTQLFESMKSELGQIPLPVKLICLSLVPAVCEELTFRGFLLSSLADRVPSVTAIVITALLFGLFHVFVGNTLMFERFVPTAFMGLLLGIVCVRTGSIFPGMLLHVVHNGLLITMAHYESDLSKLGVGNMGQEHLPTNWILMAVAPITVAVFFVVAWYEKTSNLNGRTFFVFELVPRNAAFQRHAVTPGHELICLD